MKHTTRLSYLMVLSWETEFEQAIKTNLYGAAQIQRKKKRSRSKSLQAAWAITLNEDITIYYLVKRHSHISYPNKVQAKHLTLFSSH